MVGRSTEMICDEYFQQKVSLNTFLSCTAPGEFCYVADTIMFCHAMGLGILLHYLCHIGDCSFLGNPSGSVGVQQLREVRWGKAIQGFKSK